MLVVATAPRHGASVILERAKRADERGVAGQDHAAWPA